ncbi:hypothetical protein LK09_11155 [Microbacterium mangrovi]|uniref:Right handed beta helix domain-containing protein n=1 Tax=Microbacterium mangrovi TaxID=1348253 RepID=A0A0B2A728_9MICO|nr:hypothetical protein [Microbacterium mangrovi]KHK97352.1 hypothetical protein LK09_11155 [Microbacterium mangrovi]
MVNITRFKVLGTLAAVGALLLAGGPAMAAPPTGSAYTCSGQLPSGVYSSITVVGECDVPSGAVVTVSGNITVTAGSALRSTWGLDAPVPGATITVGHNVTGAPGSLVELGCTMAHGNCDPASTVLVKGNVTLDAVYDAALNGIEVLGNVTSTGGGSGPNGFPFSVKDDHIHGNLTVSDLNGSWFGVIRTAVDHNTTLTNITLSDPDGNEIVADSFGHNLSCTGMSPAPQLGDAVVGAPPGYGPSTVGGKATGQCSTVG